MTGPRETSVAWAPPDASLGDELSDRLAVLRVPGPQLQEGRWAGRVNRWLDRTSSFGRWWATSAARVALEAGPFDLVYASMSPFETAWAAQSVARARGIPWVADLRDPWALDEWTVYPTALHRRRDLWRMRVALRTSAAVIANTPEAGKEIRARVPELERRVSVVPNGWDADDFASVVRSRSDEAFRIVYVGYSHVEAGTRHRRAQLLRRVLGGATNGLDVLARSHVFLVEAIERLRATEPSLAARIELHLAGASPAEPDGRVAVSRHGYLEHAKALELVCSADLLFLPMHDLPVGTRTRTVPGKTYEYLASGRPILAALPDGDAHDMLAELPHVRVCRPRDVDCIARSIRAFAAEETAAPPPDVAARFERRRIAEQIVEVFDQALEARPEDR